jgi:hypothetical protein
MQEDKKPHIQSPLISNLPSSSTDEAYRQGVRDGFIAAVAMIIMFSCAFSMIYYLTHR